MQISISKDDNDGKSCPAIENNRGELSRRGFKILHRCIIIHGPLRPKRWPSSPLAVICPWLQQPYTGAIGLFLQGESNCSAGKLFGRHWLAKTLDKHRFGVLALVIKKASATLARLAIAYTGLQSFFRGALWCSVLHSLSVLAWPLQPLIILSTRLVRTGRTRRIRSPFSRSYKNKTRAEEKKCTLIILLLNTIIIGCLFYLPRRIATCFYKFKKLSWTIPNRHQMQVRRNKSSDQQIDDF